jgi:hypothetical protein
MSSNIIEIFIRNIFINNIIEIDDIIKNDQIQQEDLIKIMNYFIYFYVKKKFNYKMMFILLYIIFVKYKCLTIDCINDTNYVISFGKWNNCKRNGLKLLETIRDSNLVERELGKILKNFRQTHGTIRHHTKNCGTVNDLVYIFKYHIHPIMESFNDSSFIHNLHLTDNFLFEKKINTKEWQAEHVQEIKNRLTQLVLFFGFNLFKYINIKVIANTEFELLDFKDKVKYYEMCISKVNEINEIIHKLFEMKFELQNYFNLLNIEYEKIKKRMYCLTDKSKITIKFVKSKKLLKNKNSRSIT